MQVSRSAVFLTVGLVAGAHLGCSGPDAARPSGGGGAQADGGVPPDAGVSPPARRVAGAVSGARLSVRSWRAAADGPAVFDRLTDTQLGVDCEFAAAADQTTRCLPTLGPGLAELYSDAACSTQLVEAPACDEPPRYVAVRREAASCPRAFQAIHRVGPMLPATTVYARSSAGPCAAQAAMAGRAYYEVGAEVDPREFVAATQVVVGNGPLAARGYVAEDGTELYRELWDTRLGRCDAQLGAEVCAPLDLGSYSPNPTYRRFADASCTTPAYYIPTTCAASGAGDDGVPPQEYLPLGPPLQGSVYAVNEHGACVVDPLILEGLNYHAARGAAVPASNLAAVATQTEGSGRVVVRRVSDPNGSVKVAQASFFDTQANAGCLPVLESDGYHCQPAAEGTVGYYLDDACTRPIVIAEPPPATVVTPLPHPDSCHLVREVRVVVGQKVSSAAPYDVYVLLGRGGACRRLAARTEPYYELGARVDTPPLLWE